MIVAFVTDRRVKAAVLAAALPEEDVVLGVESGLEAIHRGFPRLLVLPASGAVPVPSSSRPPVPVLRVDAGRVGTLSSRSAHSFADSTASDLRRAIQEAAEHGSWVDGLFRDLSVAAGAPLPRAFRGFCRRVLEYPARYGDLHAMARLTGLSRGALKARFRRGGLRSPAEHLRWLRVIAVAHVLQDPDVTTVAASYRLGFTSNGNLCRAVQSIAEVKPGDLRDAAGRAALLVRFVERFGLAEPSLQRWGRFDSVFLRKRVA